MYVDILILYEHKTRELSNACLLASELEYRGYSVMVCCMYDPRRKNIHAQVMIVPHLYDESQLLFYSNSDLDCRNIIDLQYEQVLNDSYEDDVHNPSGAAMKAYHIAWGNRQYCRYLSHGIAEDKVLVSGHISMDFYKPIIKDFFLSKKEISREFSLNPDKDWILFMSSFSYASRSPEELKRYKTMFEYTYELSEISDSTLAELLHWFEKMLKDNPEKYLIYRPHPAEPTIPGVQQLEYKYPNFRYINKYSIGQWVHCADLFLNWISTSVVDVYYTKKPCCILRPLEVPNFLDTDFLINAKKISSYEELSYSIKIKSADFPVKSELIEDYYGKVSDDYAFMKIVDLCEKLMKDPSMGYDYSSYVKCINTEIHSFRYYFTSLLYRINQYYKLNPQFFLFRSRSSIIDKYNRDVYNSKKEIGQYMKRLRPIIQQFHTNDR